jgi:hydrogenase maturation protease
MAVSAEQSSPHINPGTQNLPRTLIFTWGNPSRGDDAIGPEIYNHLIANLPDGVDLLTDFQLQIEHITDLEGRDRIIFVDASVSAEAPFEYQRIYPEEDNSYTTHAMSPQALLSVYRKVNGEEPPEAWLLSVRGYEFGLGKELSGQANDNIKKALLTLSRDLNTAPFEN